MIRTERGKREEWGSGFESRPLYLLGMGFNLCRVISPLRPQLLGLWVCGTWEAFSERDFLLCAKYLGCSAVSAGIKAGPQGGLGGR